MSKADSNVTASYSSASIAPLSFMWCNLTPLNLSNCKVSTISQLGKPNL